jgi:hypothetical protein
MRIFGVLQRFALVYFVVAVLYVFLTSRSYGQPQVRLEYNVSSKYCVYGVTVNIYLTRTNDGEDYHLSSDLEVAIFVYTPCILLLAGQQVDRKPLMYKGHNASSVCV